MNSYDVLDKVNMLGMFDVPAAASQVSRAPLSTLVAMLFYNGSDATVAVGDALLQRAGEAMVQRVSCLLRERESVALLQGSAGVQGKHVDRYGLEQLLLDLESRR